MKIRKIGIIGAGVMGSGIAQKIAQEGIHVVIVDIEDRFVQKGLDNIKKCSSSSKVVNVKSKIIVWGKDIFKEYPIAPLLKNDKEYLKNVIRRYVVREFFKFNSKNNTLSQG